MKTIIVTNALTKEENIVLVHQILVIEPTTKQGCTARIMLQNGGAVFTTENQTALNDKIKNS